MLIDESFIDFLLINLGNKFNKVTYLDKGVLSCNSLRNISNDILNWMVFDSSSFFGKILAFSIFLFIMKIFNLIFFPSLDLFLDLNFSLYLQEMFSLDTYIINNLYLYKLGVSFIKGNIDLFFYCLISFIQNSRCF